MVSIWVILASVIWASIWSAPVSGSTFKGRALRKRTLNHEKYDFNDMRRRRTRDFYVAG
jgi:hypothetical protein